MVTHGVGANEISHNPRPEDVGENHAYFLKQRHQNLQVASKLISIAIHMDAILYTLENFLMQ